MESEHFLPLSNNFNESFREKLHRNICAKVHKFLLNLASKCEDKKFAEDVQKAIATMQEKSIKFTYLDDRKDDIKIYIDDLHSRIQFLESELEKYRSLENTLSDKYRNILQHIISLYEKNRYSEIYLILIDLKTNSDIYNGN